VVSVRFSPNLLPALCRSQVVFAALGVSKDAVVNGISFEFNLPI
jgi:hypothetical protein